jgi:hypothetical protein
MLYGRHLLLNASARGPSGDQDDLPPPAIFYFYFFYFFLFFLFFLLVAKKMDIGEGRCCSRPSPSRSRRWRVRAEGAFLFDDDGSRVASRGGPDHRDTRGIVMAV